MNDLRFLEFKIDEKHDNTALRDILRFEYGFSVALLRRTKKNESYLTVNNSPARLSDRAKSGDTIRIYIGDDEKSTLIPIEGDVDIIYEDDDIAVINKPAGVVSHPSPGHPEEPSIAGFLTHKWNNTNWNFHAVNRLDRGTSGIMVAAKNGYSHSILSSYLHTDQFKRTYIAVVCGKPDKQCGVIDAPIDRDMTSIVKRCVSPSGVEAVTNYSVISSTDEFSLVKLEPMTGRTHQLRVHMAYIGHPLAGDFLYGTEDPSLISRHALHSCSCSFVHPTMRTVMEFVCPIPSDMRNLMKYDK